ncbi:hypothetical protein BDN71DRAFT_1439399 [Pleurotus eryngii]|uniref:Uncharacterized protein n=1 Tax=Pleurotus eryngii TaxID=5323 RepID=A0A9P6DC29_PLEER|nr:hypothetical protein BDN71DRAFT_1439399 [Pleurotus eryngii]
MSSSTTTLNGAHPHGPTLASILGVKGPLRFRPHGSSQKPHVVLRRVQIPDDASEHGESNTIVYFSLFASKRIEVKPGKEILLSVDGGIENHPILLEGDLVTREEEKAVENLEDDLPQPTEVIPPKMRRGWKVRSDEGNENPVSVVKAFELPVVHESIGIQVERILTAAYTQTEVSNHSVSVQAEPVVQGVAVQSDATPYTSTSIQVTESRVLTSTDVQTEPPPPPVSPVSARRSLSPMELDSPSNSRLPSPASPRNVPLVAQAKPSHTVHNTPRTMSPSQTDSTQPSVIFSPPTRPLASLSRASSIASSSGAQDMQLSPIEEKQRNKPFQTSFIPQHPLVEATVHDNSIDSTPHSSPPPSVEEGESAEGDQHYEIERGSQQLAPIVETHNRKGFIKVEDPADDSTAIPTSSPSRKRKRSLAQEIVAPEPEATTSGQHYAPRLSPPVPSPAVLCVPPTPMSTSLLNPITASPPPALPSSPPRVLRDELPPSGSRPLSQRPMSDLPKPSNFFVPASKAPAQANKPLPTHPRLPPTQPQAMSGRVRGGAGQTSSLDARSFGYIPTGPMSNPLGIRPSAPPTAPSAMVNNGQSQKAPPTAPKLLVNSATVSAPKMPGSLKGLTQPTPTNGSSTSATPQRKKLVVGNSWSAAKASGSAAQSGGGTTPTSNGLSLAARLTDKQAGSATRTSSADIDVDLPYGSEPPPPPPPQPITPAPPQHLPPAQPVPPPPPASPPSQPDPPPIPGLIPTPPPTGTIKWRPAVLPMTWNPSTSAVPYAPPNLMANKAPIKITTKPPAPPASFQPNVPKSEPLDLFEIPIPVEAINPSPKPTLAHTPISLASRLTSHRNPNEIPLPPSPLRAFPNLTSIESRPVPSPITNGPPKDPIPGSSTVSPKTPYLPMTLPMTHPLPPKPIAAPTRPGPRGVKRESPEEDIHKKRRRKFRWPTVDPLRTVALKGEGDLSVKKIAFNSDGTHFAICCSDRTVRIWSNQNYAELARLTHNAPVVSVLWLTGDTGVITLSDDGVVSKWIKTGPNHWQWAKILDAGNERRADDDPMCLAYRADRIAVSFPKIGVKVWLWSKGTWQPQRSIVRQNVTAIKFVDDGQALLGGTKDGVLWYCEIPNGTLRAYAFLRSKVTQIDINRQASQALLAQSSACCHLVWVEQSDNKGKVEQVYSFKDLDLRTEFGAVYAAQDQAVLFGDVEGCIPVWDKKKAVVVYGLDHGEDTTIQAVASCDHPSKDVVPCILTGTKEGQLSWWSQPASNPQASSTDEASRKRHKGSS